MYFSLNFPGKPPLFQKAVVILGIVHVFKSAAVPRVSQLLGCEKARCVALVKLGHAEAAGAQKLLRRFQNALFVISEQRLKPAVPVHGDADVIFAAQLDYFKGDFRIGKWQIGGGEKYALPVADGQRRVKPAHGAAVFIDILYFPGGYLRIAPNVVYTYINGVKIFLESAHSGGQNRRTILRKGKLVPPHSPALPAGKYYGLGYDVHPLGYR